MSPLSTTEHRSPHCWFCFPVTLNYCPIAFTCFFFFLQQFNLIWILIYTKIDYCLNLGRRRRTYSYMLFFVTYRCIVLFSFGEFKNAITYHNIDACAVDQCRKRVQDAPPILYLLWACKTVSNWLTLISTPL